MKRVMDGKSVVDKFAAEVSEFAMIDWNDVPQDEKRRLCQIIERPISVAHDTGIEICAKFVEMEPWQDGLTGKEVAEILRSQFGKCSNGKLQ